jgi:DNA-binding CsgD family transcriptional regulator
LSDQLDEAIHAQERALKYRRELGDLRKEADSLRSLSRLLRFVGRVQEAAEAGQQAVALLEALPPGRELAMAYNNLSHLYVAIEEAERTVAWGTRALELAASLDDTENLVYALTNVGVADYLAGAGSEKLELSLERALEAGLEEPAGRAFLSLVVWPLRQRSYELVDRYIEAGVEYCTDRGLDLWRLYLLACRARSELDRGRWTEAVDSAALVLRDPRTAPVPRIYALVVVGLVRARRGDPDVWSQLDEAFALAEPSGELLRVGRGSAARAEAAWLEGRHEAVAAATDAALELARRRRAPWAIGELAYWRWRAGVREDVPLGAAEPYALSIRGNWRRAAEMWRKIGCPYEAALALAEADDDDALRRALEELHRLGAQPAAAIVARRLRERGARGLPRGPRPTTQKNPANLTAREIEVLGLVAQGLRNAQIAERLVLSEKTIDHHVSAILRKLDVRTRGEASAQAVSLGLAGQDR